MRGSDFPEIDFNRFILPPVEMKIVRRNGIFKVFDPLRKIYVTLTHEEFVRQAFTAWLIHHLNYPPSVMANEITINLNDTLKRCDTVIFDVNGNPLMIVEYKAPKVRLSQEVFNQIVRYNMVLKARYLVVSNGYSNFCCKVDYSSHKVDFLTQVPDYPSIVSNS